MIIGYCDTIGEWGSVTIRDLSQYPNILRYFWINSCRLKPGRPGQPLDAPLHAVVIDEGVPARDRVTAEAALATVITEGGWTTGCHGTPIKNYSTSKPVVQPNLVLTFDRATAATVGVGSLEIMGERQGAVRRTIVV